ncbi:hypothetical protein XOCgx_0916 [Xanthomonas oryzae pv. oryzicola]|nr:hypothetical protein XOCgx_0916 [Xanthomonas oryzae pv. oryzicola]
MNPSMGTNTSKRLEPGWRRSTCDEPAPTPPPSGGKPTFAGRIERCVERRTGRGELLQHFADGGQAGALDVGAVERLDRYLTLQFGGSDARAGDLHAVERARARCGLGLLRPSECGNQTQRQLHGQA